MFYLAGLRVQGPASWLCALTPGGGGGGSIKTTLYDPASGQSTMYKASRLIYSFLAYFRYIQRAGSALLQAILASRRFTSLCTLQIILYICTVCFQAALKAASHHSNTLVCFCVHCHSISNHWWVACYFNPYMIRNYIQEILILKRMYIYYIMGT